MTRFSTEARTTAGRALFKDKKKKAPDNASEAPSAVQMGEHGRYQIKSGRLSKKYVARAFPKPPTNARDDRRGARRDGGSRDRRAGHRRGCSLSEMRLANAAGYKSNVSANRALASAGLLIASYLSFDADANGAAGNADGTVLPGYRGAKRSDEDPGNWILRPEVGDAVRFAF